MEIPSEKNAASPITGRSPRAEGPDSSATVPAGTTDEDISITDDIFQLPVIPLPPRMQPREPVAAAVPPSPPPVAVPVVKTPEAAQPSAEEAPNPDKERERRRMVRLERRTPPGQNPAFKRLLRPDVALAAHTAASQARAESPVAMEKVGRESMQFGKKNGATALPGYRPNKLVRVLDSIYTNSPLRWLDFIERGGPRLAAFTLIAVGVIGFIAWQYYNSMREREYSANQNRVVVLTPEQRTEAARAVVEQFMAAKTIEDRLPFVSDPARAAPRMRQYYETQKGLDPQITDWQVGNPATSPHGELIPVVFKESSGREFRVVMGDSETGPRLDWENFVAFGDVPWTEFCKTRSVTPKALRVRMKQVEKYEGNFKKEEWQSYEIEHRSGAPRLTGYARRAGRTTQALTELSKSGNWQNAQLYLRFDNKLEGDHQVVIEDVVRSRWQDEATAWSAK